jgi:hypothetical protein
VVSIIIAMEENVFRIKVFEDDELKIKTRSGRSIRFKVVCDGNDIIFGYRTDIPKLDIHLVGSCPGEVFSNIPKAVLAKYRSIMGMDVRFMTKRQKALKKRYIERFEEV